VTEGEKDQTGQRPMRGEMLKPLTEKPYGSGTSGLRDLLRTKNEKGAYKGRCFVGRVRGERSPRGLKAQGSKRPRPELILWVARRGTAELMGVSH